MFGLGFWELLFILVIVLVLFGVKRIPQLGSSLGQGIKNFTTAFKDESPEEKPKENLTEGAGSNDEPDRETKEKTAGEKAE